MVLQVMQGVLLLVKKAKDVKEVSEWKTTQPHMREELVKMCTTYDASVKGNKKAWSESKKATKGLTSDEVFTRGSAAVQIFMKWMEVCRLVRKVSEDLRAIDKSNKGDAGGDDKGGDDDEEEEEEE